MCGSPEGSDGCRPLNIYYFESTEAFNYNAWDKHADAPPGPFCDRERTKGLL